MCFYGRHVICIYLIRQVSLIWELKAHYSHHNYLLSVAIIFSSACRSIKSHSLLFEGHPFLLMFYYRHCRRQFRHVFVYRCPVSFQEQMVKVASSVKRKRIIWDVEVSHCEKERYFERCDLDSSRMDSKDTYSFHSVKNAVYELKLRWWEWTNVLRKWLF